MTPGPAPVPEEVLLEMARPVIHSRDPRTKQAIKEATEGLQEVFQTKNDVVIMAATGTGAMEAAAVNAVPPGGRPSSSTPAGSACAGPRSARPTGSTTITLDFEWGQPVDPQARRQRA